MRPKSPLLTLAEICKRLNVASPALPEKTAFSGLSTVELAGPKDITFFLRPKMRNQAAKCKAGLILVQDTMEFDDPRALFVPNVWTALLSLMAHFHPSKPVEEFIHPTAVIHPTAHIGTNVFLGPYVVIGEGVTVGDQSRIEAHCVIGDYVQVGSNCLLYPNVTIYQDCRIGDRVILHSGAVIGADGFKYEFLNGRLTKIPQVGNVVLEAEVEVGANSTIDRAGFSETRIGSRTKIDNLVHIAHNCIIGSDCIIVGQTGIAGSTTLGRGVIVAGQVGIGDHTTIGDGAKIGAKAGLKGNFPAGAELLGSPAVPVDEFMKIYTASRRLPKMLQRLQPLLDQLEAEEKASE